MSKDTSIDLDSKFAPKKQEQPQKQHKTSKAVVNWDEVFTEWCYKIPKGYPTIVDGVFTEYEEVRILNEILEEKFAVSIPLPEAKPVKDFKQAATYVANAIPKLKTKDLVSVKPFEGKDGGITVIRLEVDSTKSRLPVAIELAKVLGGKVAKSSAGETLPKVQFELNGVIYICSIKPTAKETKTDTDIKEGLSVVISYYPDYLTEFDGNQIDKTNYKDAVKKLLRFLKQKDAVAGLSKSVIDSCEKFLQKGLTLQSKKDINDYVSVLNQNSSHANTFDLFFQKNPDWYIERDELFNAIRSAAHDISKTKATPSGLPADKWCPGDVYFIKNGSEGFIASEIERAKQETNPNGLNILNNLFSDKFLEPESKKPIVAVSLKMEKAQAGKLKSALEQYTDIKKDYSLDDAELKLPKAELVTKAEALRKSLLKFTREGDVDVTWTSKGSINPSDLKKIKDPRIIRCKLASYKALNFIYQKIANSKFDKLDDALVNLVVFGLGVIKDSPDTELNKLQSINPPFFKAIASSSGNGMSKPILFKGGKLNTIALWDPSGKNDPKISIVDNEDYAGISIELGVQVGANKFDCLVNFRPNKTGESQITIELQRADHK